MRAYNLLFLLCIGWGLFGQNVVIMPKKVDTLAGYYLLDREGFDWINEKMEEEKSGRGLDSVWIKVDKSEYERVLSWRRGMDPAYGDPMRQESILGILGSIGPIIGLVEGILKKSGEYNPVKGVKAFRKMKGEVIDLEEKVKSGVLREEDYLWLIDKLKSIRVDGGLK